MAGITQDKYIQINECMDLLFSSSGDDDDINKIVEFVSLKKTENTPKLKNFINVVRAYTDEEFRKHFRMRRQTAYTLIERYNKDFISTLLRENDTEAEVDILVFIWFASNKDSLRCVATLFGISVRTVFEKCKRVMDYLLHIAKDIIKFPSQNAAADFETIAGFPNVIGCIDGTSIHVLKPAHKIASTYVNRHDQVSVTLQAVCDANRRFIDVLTGVPGRVHDARTFKFSDLSEVLPRLCGKQYHLLGDAAYPIREYLIVPFNDYGTLSQREESFNKKHCQTRVRIENAFGILKSRFRQLLKVDMHTVDKISKFILSCCVLHNLCIEINDTWDEDVVVIDQQVQENPIPADHVNNAIPDNEDTLKGLGELKRYFLMRNM